MGHTKNGASKESHTKKTARTNNCYKLDLRAIKKVALSYSQFLSLFHFIIPLIICFFSSIFFNCFVVCLFCPCFPLLISILPFTSNLLFCFHFHFFIPSFSQYFLFPHLVFAYLSFCSSSHLMFLLFFILSSRIVFFLSSNSNFLFYSFIFHSHFFDPFFLSFSFRHFYSFPVFFLLFLHFQFFNWIFVPSLILFPFRTFSLFSSISYIKRKSNS